jgi:hypothetical protein
VTKKTKKNAAKPEFELPEVEPGLLICYGITPEQEAIVRGVIEHNVRRGSKLGAVRHSAPRNVTALHAGPTQLSLIAAEFADSFTKNLEGKALEKLGSYTAQSLTATAGRFDWTGSASRTVLKERIDDANGHCITFVAVLERGDEQALANTLGHVAEDARNARAYVICFVVAPAEQGRVLAGIGVDAIEIGACEREPRASMAFSAKSMAARPFHGLGLGHVMCNVYLSNERSRQRYERFVAEDLGTRVMSMLKGHGCSDDMIARAFNIKSRTTVMRRLKALPPPRKHKLDEKTMKKYVDHLGLDGEIMAELIRKSPSKT